VIVFIDYIVSRISKKTKFNHSITKQVNIKSKKNIKKLSHQQPTKSNKKKINQNKENKATAKPTIKLIIATSEDADFFFELVEPTFNSQDPILP